MRMHSGAIIPIERLGHEGHGFVMPARDIAHNIFVHHHLIGHLDQGIESKVDFGLARCGHFMMMLLHLDSDFFHLPAHFRPDILLRVDRSHGEIAFLMARAGPEVDSVFPRIPDAFF